MFSWPRSLQEKGQGARAGPALTSLPWPLASPSPPPAHPGAPQGDLGFFFSLLFFFGLFFFFGWKKGGKKKEEKQEKRAERERNYLGREVSRNAFVCNCLKHRKRSRERTRTHTENREKRAGKTQPQGARGRISAGKWQDRRKKREEGAGKASLTFPIPLSLDLWAGRDRAPTPRVLLEFTAPRSLREGWERLPGTGIRLENHWDEREGPSRPFGGCWGSSPWFFILLFILVSSCFYPGLYPAVSQYSQWENSTGGRWDPALPSLGWGSRGSPGTHCHTRRACPGPPGWRRPASSEPPRRLFPAEKSGFWGKTGMRPGWGAGKGATQQCPAVGRARKRPRIFGNRGKISV